MNNAIAIVKEDAAADPATDGVVEQPTVARTLLPVCASCRRIRQDGIWVPLACAKTAYKDTDFTHGLCPDCLRMLYPEVADIVLEEVGALIKTELLQRGWKRCPRPLQTA